MFKKTIFIKIFICLIIMLIVPIITIGVFVHTNILDYMKNQIKGANIEKLSIVQNNIESILRDSEKIALRISYDGRLNHLYELKNKSQPWTAEDIYIIRDIQNLLEETIRSYDNIQSIYLYNETNETVITSNKGYYLIDSFYDKAFLEEYLANEKGGWLTPRSVNTGTKIANKSNEQSLIEDVTDVVTYVYPLTTYVTKLKGAVIVNVLERNLLEVMQEITTYSTDYIHILNQQGNIIMSSSEMLSGYDGDYLDSIFANNLSVDEQKNAVDKVVRISDNQYMLAQSGGELNNWSYISITPINDLMSKVNSSKMLFVYLSVILTIIGILISYLVSSKLYNPLKELIEDIKRIKGITFDTKDEFLYLNKAVKSILTDEQRANDLIEINKENMIKSYLVGLINDEVSDGEQYKSYQEDFPFQFFGYIAVVIDNYKDLSQKQSDNVKLNYLKTLILKTVENGLGEEEAKCYGFMSGEDSIAFIINSKYDYSQDYEGLKSRLNLLQMEISKTLECTITISIGEFYNSINDIKKSYAQAQEAMKNRIVLGRAAIIVFTAMSQRAYSKYYYPLNEEKILLNNIELGFEEQTKQIIESLIHRIKFEMFLRYDNVHYIMNQLVNNAIKYISEKNINITGIVDVYGIVDKLSDKYTIDEMKECLIDLYIGIIKYRQSEVFYIKDYVKKTFEYIDKNFKKDMDVSTISNEIGVSYSHLRKIFKDETGENIVGYINRLRIMEAKRLLKNTDMNVFEIAIEVGYNNDQSFNRFFKKYEGITPTQYRNGF